MEPNFSQAASIPGAQAIEQGISPGLQAAQAENTQNASAVQGPMEVPSIASEGFQEPSGGLPAQGSAPSGSNIITGIQNSVPGAKNMTPMQIAAELNQGITGQNPNTFLNALKESLPSLKDVPNKILGPSILKQINDMANQGQLSSGNQAIDIGIQAPQQTTWYGKVADFIGKFTFEPIVNTLLNIGTDILKPELKKTYTDALNINKQVSQNLITAIAQKQSQGQDTSKLQEALKNELANVPQPKDYFDQSTLRRINETTGQNIEELAGNATQAAAGVAALIPGIGEAEGAIAGEVSRGLEPSIGLGAKIASGAKTGAAFGAAFGGGGAASKGEGVGDVTKSALTGGLFGGITGGALEGGLGIASKGLGATGRSFANIGDEAVEDFAKTPRTPEETDAAINFIKERDAQAKALAKNPLSESPTEAEAQAQYNEDSKAPGNVYNAAKELQKQAGIAKGKVLETEGTKPINIDTLVSNLNKELKKRNFTEAYNSVYRNFENDLIAATKTKGGATLKSIDDFLMDYRNTDFTKTFGKRIGSVLNSFVKSVNDAAKEVGGDEYTKALADYKRYSDSVNSLDELKGEKNPETGKYNKAASIVEESTKTKGDNRQLFQALDKQLGDSVEVGGMSPVERNNLSKFIEDLRTGKSPQAAVGDLRVAYNPEMMIARTLIGLVNKGLKDPDIIIAKIIDLLEQSKK